MTEELPHTEAAEDGAAEAERPEEGADEEEEVAATDQEDEADVISTQKRYTP